MAADISLLFIGGSSDSGKTILAETLATKLNKVKPQSAKSIRMSEYMRQPLGAPEDKELSAAVVYVDWKSMVEKEAVDRIGMTIDGYRSDNSAFSTLIINTHFATYSPGGYMTGMDPSSIVRICSHCSLHPLPAPTSPQPASAIPKPKAAVVLVDIGANNVFQMKATKWKTKDFDEYPTINGLIDDLEMNRLYSLQYYHILCSVLRVDRVLYYRAYVNDHMDLHKPLEETSEFKLTMNNLEEFLVTQGFLSK